MFKIGSRQQKFCVSCTAAFAMAMAVTTGDAVECPVSPIFSARFVFSDGTQCPGGSISLSDALELFDDRDEQCIPPFLILGGDDEYEVCHDNQCGQGQAAGCRILHTIPSNSATQPEQVDREFLISQLEAPFVQTSGGFDECTYTDGLTSVAATVWFHVLGTTGGARQIVEAQEADVTAPINGTFSSGCSLFLEPDFELLLRQRIEEELEAAMLEDVEPLHCHLICPVDE